jgi:hypothetical protein
MTVPSMLEGRPSLMQEDTALLSTFGMIGGGPQYGVSASSPSSPPVPAVVKCVLLAVQQSSQEAAQGSVYSGESA